MRFAETADVGAVAPEAELALEFVGIELEVRSVVAGGFDEGSEVFDAFGRPGFRVVATGKALERLGFSGGKPLGAQVVDLGFADAQQLFCGGQRQFAVVETADDAFGGLGTEAVSELRFHAGKNA